MQQTVPKCSKCVSGNTKFCKYCNGSCIKHGNSKQGNQRFLCKTCNKTFVGQYRYNTYLNSTNSNVVKLLKEGCGIRSIARLLNISATTVLKKIQQIAKATSKPPILFAKTYEMDELCTYVQQKTKQLWVAYAMQSDTKAVVDFTVGSRTTKTLQLITEALVLSNATKVCTDKLPQYKSLLPSAIHCTKQYGTNHIERKNLSLRSHLKRLNRRTICFSKSAAMLTACLTIYFWG